MYNYTDRRIIINSRQPAENEFVLHEQVTMSHAWIKDLMSYIERNSNLSVEWIDQEHFVERSMSGFRIVKKDD